VRKHGGGLVADLARGKRRLNFGQLLQLGADTEPVGGRMDRHVASARDPGSRGDVAVDQVSACPLDIAGFRAKVTLERVYDPTIPRQIHAAALSASKELPHGLLKLKEGCAPFPQHDQSIPNRCSSVKH
jgi:hypothetical protein